MRLGRPGASYPLLAVTVVLVVVVAAFGVYALESSASLSRTASAESSLSALASADSEAIAFQESSISCLQQEVARLQSALNSTSTMSGTLASCTSTGASLGLLNFTGTLTVESGVGTGQLVVTVWNGGQVPVSGVFLNVTWAGLGSPNGPPVFAVGGEPVSLTNLLTQGKTAVGSANLVSGSTGLFDGYGYDFQLKVTFANGSSGVTTLNVKATV